METRQPNQLNRTRRDFMTTAKSVGILGAIAMLIGKGTSVAPSAVTPELADDVSDSGYRETEHIRKYYDSTRF
jgi:hypothetical protein